MADFEYSDDQELRRLAKEVAADPDDFEAWNKLVPLASTQEGGLNRNSNPAAITATRDVFDAFLRRFPLFFGYWSKYADLEFAIAGPEAAEMVYERGVASVFSVDLWSKYCAFKVETCHDSEVNRELFERGLDIVGLDYQAHPLWDKYIEYEERMDASKRVFAILKRLIHIPLHQYARYFERFRNMAAARPIEELASEKDIAKLTAEINNEAMGREVDLERELREKLDQTFLAVFQNTQSEVTARWTYEAGAKRPYYLVADLEDDQLENWRKYLDYEEAQGNIKRIFVLYERCLVPAAHYEEFWFRFTRWLVTVDKIEDARNAFQRASAAFVPISCPAIRLHYAYFEESQGRSDVAVVIHQSIMDKIPASPEVIASFVNTHRRQEGVQSAIEKVKEYLEDPGCHELVKSIMASEHARLALMLNSDAAQAREVYKAHHESFFNISDGTFWTRWMEFELLQATFGTNKSDAVQSLRSIVDDLLHKTNNLPMPVVENLVSRYLIYLQEQGGQDAMSEFLKVEKQINGPLSISDPRKQRAGITGQLGINAANGDPHSQAQAPIGPANAAMPHNMMGAGPQLEKSYNPYNPASSAPVPANGGQVSQTQTSKRWQRHIEDSESSEDLDLSKDWDTRADTDPSEDSDDDSGPEPFFD